MTSTTYAIRFDSNIGDFTKSMNYHRGIPRLDWIHKCSTLIVEALSEAVGLTEWTRSLDSGAFRVRHSIRQGADILFRDGVSPEPDVLYPSQKALNLPPIFNRPQYDEATLIEDIVLEMEDVDLFNDRPYALDLENGSEKTGDARLIYEQTVDYIVGRAEDLIAQGITIGFKTDFIP